MSLSLRAVVGAIGLCASSIIPCTSASAAPTLGIDKSISKVSGWSIGLNKSLNGCLAAATYQDQTTV